MILVMASFAAFLIIGFAWDRHQEKKEKKKYNIDSN